MASRKKKQDETPDDAPDAAVGGDQATQTVRIGGQDFNVQPEPPAWSDAEPIDQPVAGPEATPEQIDELVEQLHAAVFAETAEASLEARDGKVCVWDLADPEATGLLYHTDDDAILVLVQYAPKLKRVLIGGEPEPARLLVALAREHLHGVKVERC